MFPTPASPHYRKTPGPAALCCVLGGCSQSSLQRVCRAKGQERAEGLRDAPGKGPHRGCSSEWEGAGEPGPRWPVLRGGRGGGDTGGTWTAGLGHGTCIRRSSGALQAQVGVPAAEGGQASDAEGLASGCWV